MVLDQIIEGLNAPTTIDEWYEVLKAFKTQDPNGNGIDDEIPFDAGAAGLNLFYPAFDILNGALGFFSRMPGSLCSQLFARPFQEPAISP